MKFCPIDSYYLYLSISVDGTLTHSCRNCGYTDKLNPKSETDALILETSFKSAHSGAASGITINEFTKKDPTLPHITSIKCPNSECPSQENETLRDIIYIKTDPQNLKFRYICTVCDTQWSSS